MPVYVDRQKCNGCGPSKQPPCVRMCPGDLMVKDFIENKAYLRDKGECWDCYACVKPCPQDALEVKLSYQMGFFNSSLRPKVITSDMIEWHSRDTHGREDVYRIRTKYLPVAMDEVEDAEPEAFTDMGQNI